MISRAIDKRTVSIPLCLLVLLGLFSLQAAAQKAAKKEPNNEPAEASPIALNQEVSGSFGEDDDLDWFALTIPAPEIENLVVEVTGIPDVDVCLKVLAP